MKHNTHYLSFIIAIFSCCMICFGNPHLVGAVQSEAVFAGGCFWCLEHDMESLPGVLSVDSGYTGGLIENPTYLNHQGHKEAVKVKFDSSKIISYNFSSCLVFV